MGWLMQGELFTFRFINRAWCERKWRGKYNKNMDFPGKKFKMECTCSSKLSYSRRNSVDNIEMCDIHVPIHVLFWRFYFADPWEAAPVHLWTRQGGKGRRRKKKAWLHPRNSNIYLSTTWHSVRRLGLQLQPLLAIFTPSSLLRSYIFGHASLYFTLRDGVGIQLRSRQPKEIRIHSNVLTFSRHVFKPFANPPHIHTFSACHSIIIRQHIDNSKSIREKAFGKSDIFLLFLLF